MYVVLKTKNSVNVWIRMIQVDKHYAYMKEKNKVFKYLSI